MLARSSRKLGQRSFSRKLPVALRKTQLFIDGKFVDSSNNTKFATFDPHTEEVITEVHEASSQDVDQAVAAARKAFDKGPWRYMSATERGQCLYRFAELMDKNREELSLLEALDNGKTAFMANVADVNFAIQIYKYYAGYADKILGETIPMQGNFFGYTRREPIGVCAQIIPWNFPILLQSFKLAPAFAAGCTVVMKSAEQTPLSALRIAELIQEAGFPDGVFNMLSGHGETTGKYLVSHPGVDKVAFTGSTQVGLDILSNSSKNSLRPVGLELGGKSANIVMDDADLDSAVKSAHGGLFFNAGQV